MTKETFEEICLLVFGEVKRIEKLNNHHNNGLKDVDINVIKHGRTKAYLPPIEARETPVQYATFKIGRRWVTIQNLHWAFLVTNEGLLEEDVIDVVLTLKMNQILESK